MERIPQGRSATLTMTFEQDGTATDPEPDLATVTITRADGTALVPQGLVDDQGEGIAMITLTPEETADLDILQVDWFSTFGNKLQEFTTYTEIVGGFMFSLSQARQVEPLDRVDRYTTQQILAVRSLVESTLEQATGRAFVPRFTVETLNGTGTSNLFLSKPDVRRIRSVTADGTAYTVGQISELGFNPSGLLTLASGYWPAGTGNVTVMYEHGMAFTPPRVTQAALRLARSWLVSGPIDDRTSTFSTVEGGTYSLTIPGPDGTTGLPEVDAVISQYSMRTLVA